MTKAEKAARKPVFANMRLEHGVVVAECASSDGQRRYRLHASRDGEYTDCNCQGSAHDCYHKKALRAVLKEGAFLP